MASSPPSTSPFLHSPKSKCGALVISDFHGSSQSSRLSFKEMIVEIKMLYTIAFPMIIIGLLIYSKSLISMVFLGKLGKEALAGSSLAIAIANISGYSVVYGLALGAKQLPLLCQTLQHTILLLFLTCIPISILWLNIQPFLLFFSQNCSTPCSL